MNRFFGMLAAGLLLSACGGGAAPAASPSPVSAAPSTAAKPVASTAAPASAAPASASAKPAASAAPAAASGAASAKPAASGAAAPSLAPVPKVTLQLTKPLPALNPPYTVKARVGSSLTTAPFWYAIEKGYFDQLGLKFEEVQITQSADVTGPLTQGQIDIAGVAFAPGLYNAVSRGVEVQAVADNGQLQPNLAGSAAVVKKGELAKYGNDWCALKGKRIAGMRVWIVATSALGRVVMIAALGKPPRLAGGSHRPAKANTPPSSSWMCIGWRCLGASARHS